MAILIDGYNLLNVTGIFARGVGPGSLPQLHQAFLQFLVNHLDPAEVAQTTVVFDARGRRAAQRRSLRFGDMQVYYASRQEDADHLIAELIARHSAPRQLVVVSSDHQVQRAARRRRATAVDSDVWYADLLRRRKQRRRAGPAAESKPAAPLSQADTAWWMAQFSELLPDEAPESPSPTPEGGSRSQAALDERVPPADEHASTSAPFPRDYLESVERELQSGDLAASPPQPPARRAPRRRKKR